MATWPKVSSVFDLKGAEGPSVRKRTLAYCTQYCGWGDKSRHSIRFGDDRFGCLYCTQSHPPR
jgi:hypothetical protein